MRRTAGNKSTTTRTWSVLIMTDKEEGTPHHPAPVMGKPLNTTKTLMNPPEYKLILGSSCTGIGFCVTHSVPGNDQQKHSPSTYYSKYKVLLAEPPAPTFVTNNSVMLVGVVRIPLVESRLSSHDITSQ
jgi:hypothetical protein